MVSRGHIVGMKEERKKNGDVVRPEAEENLSAPQSETKESHAIEQVGLTYNLSLLPSTHITCPSHTQAQGEEINLMDSYVGHCYGEHKHRECEGWATITAKLFTKHTQMGKKKNQNKQRKQSLFLSP